MIDAISIVAGLAILVVGGELIVRGASRLALRIGLSPIVVGLTVVAFGTSSPELAVSIGSTLEGSSDVAVGNVVGSNIYNILLILGLAALVRPLVVRMQLIRFDVPLVILVSLLLWLLLLDGSLSAIDGSILVLSLIGYLAVSILIGRRDAAKVRREGEDGSACSAGDRRRRWRTSLVLVAAGLVALVFGAQLLVAGATSIARDLGFSELVIGLTVVAIGTSLPELATSVVASVRGQRDLAVGNVMGSNLFNVLGILGLSAIVAGDGLPVPEQVRSFDLPVMIVAAVACLPLLFTGRILRRWEGALFVTYALIYTAYVILLATGDPLGDLLVAAMVWFVIPLTAMTIVTVLMREVRSTRRGSSTGSTVG